MVKFQFSKQKTKSAEKISQQVFYIMIGLAVLVFGLFFLVGYDLPFEENPDFNAPLFTDVLILLMWLFLIEGTGLAVFSMIRDYRSSKSEAVVNGIPVRRIFRITWIGTLAVLLLTFFWAVLLRCSSMARIMPTGSGSSFQICLSSHRS